MAAPATHAATTISLSNGQLLAMLRQIYPDCRLASVPIRPWERSTAETTTTLSFHLTAQTTSGSLPFDREFLDEKKDERPALKREWYVRPSDVKAIEADLDGDGRSETCVAFRGCDLPQWWLPAWHQLAVFSAGAKPRLLGFRKVEKIWGFTVIIEALDVVDLGRRKVLLYRYHGTDAGATPRPYAYYAEFYSLRNGRLHCALARELGWRCGGSGICPYSTVERLDYRDLDGDGMAELLLFDRAVDRKDWISHGSGTDYILKHLPDVYCFEGDAFHLAPDLLNTTDTMRWQCLSVTLVNAWSLGDDTNRAFYCRPRDKSLEMFGGEILERFTYLPAERKPTDTVRVWAGENGQPIWTAVMHRPTNGKAESRFSVNLGDYLRAEIVEASAAEMDYTLAVPSGDAKLQLVRQSKVLKFFAGTSGLAILEKWESRASPGWEVKELQEHLAGEGLFYKLDGIRVTPALACRNSQPQKQALVLVKIYLDFDGVEFVFPEGKNSGRADRVTVRCQVRSRAAEDGTIGEALYFAAVVDTTRESWQGEVYGYIGRALEGLNRFRGEGNR